MQADVTQVHGACDADATVIDGTYRQMRKRRVPKTPAVVSLDALDQRTTAARRSQDLGRTIAVDLGGDLSALQQQLVRRLVTLAVWCEAQDVLALQGQIIDADLYGRVAGHQRRIAATLGLRRVPRDVGGMTLGDVLRAGLAADKAKAEANG